MISNVHNWLFHKNEYTGRWYAAKRDDIHLMFNDIQNPKVLSSTNPDTLVEIINKTDGNPELLNKLTKTQDK